METSNISDETGGFWKIKWKHNPTGPKERLIEDSSEFRPVILMMAREDPDAEIERIK